MLAVDTNVIVRYLTGDDVAQSHIARRLIDDNEIHLVPTVLIETEWVLRSAYAYSRERIHAGLAGFTGLPNVSTASPEQVAQALDWFAWGMDFADALHLAAAGDCAAFATFDRQLVASARKAKAGKVKAL